MFAIPTVPWQDPTTSGSWNQRGRSSTDSIPQGHDPRLFCARWNELPADSTTLL